MNSRIFAPALLLAPLLALAGCQSSYTYEPIVANPPNLEMANAQCEMLSSSAEQGMVAWGTPGYVAGAQIGNAIGNGIRVDQYMRQCMTMQGWRRVANQPAKPHATPSKPSEQISPEQRKQAIDIFAMDYIVGTCKTPTTAEQRSSLKELKAMAGSQLIAEGRAKGKQIADGNIKMMGKPEFCKRATAIFKDAQKK